VFFPFCKKRRKKPEFSLAVTGVSAGLRVTSVQTLTGAGSEREISNSWVSDGTEVLSMADWGKQVTLLLWVRYLGDKGAYLRVSSAESYLFVRRVT
jgi:hypothetical protein